MSFRVYDKEYEGQLFDNVFPSWTTDRTAQKYFMKKLVEHVRNGGFIHVKLTKGARKGSIARWDISADELQNLYHEGKNGYGEVLAASHDIKLVFDDRDNVITSAIRYGDGIQGTVHFNMTQTVWAFQTNAQPKKAAKVLHDHFGVVLAPGQIVMFPMGPKGDTHTRFGIIESITAAGTIKVEAMASRPGHTKVSVNVSPVINPSDLIVIDEFKELKDKLMLAKLAHA